MRHLLVLYTQKNKKGYFLLSKYINFLDDNCFYMAVAINLKKSIPNLKQLSQGIKIFLR